MHPVTSCPDPDLLRRFSSGELSEEQIDFLAEHIDRCSACTEAIQKLPAADTLVAGLESTVSELLPPELHRVMDRLRQLPFKSTDTLGGEATLASPLDVLAAPQADDEIGRLAHYRVLKLLGQGGMGAVFLAHDVHLDRPVALKVMLPHAAAKPAARERFLREARLAAKVEHDHIVPIYHVGEHQGLPFLAMPVLKGCSLSDLLEKRGRLPIELAVRLARQMAQGLAAAHERGLIHRDVKPSNVWLESPLAPREECGASDPDGDAFDLLSRSERTTRVKLLDFGLARLEQDNSHLTQSGTVLGTPAYMSPEQSRGEKVDARSDLWSLGVILYDMTTGTLPFSAATTMGVLTSIAVDQPASPASIRPDVPRELSKLVMRLLEKDPAKRPASARQVEQTLAGIEREWEKAHHETHERHEKEEPAKSSEPRPSWSGGGRRWLVAALVLALLGPLGYYFGGTIIRIATNRGELVVVVDDPNVEIKVVQNGVVVHDRTREREFTLTTGQGQIEVFEKDGIKLLTREFALSRGGKTTVRVALQDQAAARPPKTPSPLTPGPLGTDPDRRAAEYVLSIGGIIRVNDRRQDIRAISELPGEPFRLTCVSLRLNPRVTDAGLAHLKDCKNLKFLLLNFTQVSDAGVAHFNDCKNLTRLHLNHTQVTDAGLAHFKNCKNLRDLYLNHTQVTDAGLAYFKNCKGVMYLSLDGTQVSDAGLAHFKDCKNVTTLILASTRVSDAGLAHFKHCKGLTVLDLNRTQVTDAGLAHFNDCKNLTRLHLNHTQVTDAGLAHFKNCKSLTTLNLGRTQVSDAGLSYFRDYKNLLGLDVADTRVTDLSLPWIAAQQGGGEFNLENTRISRRAYEQLKAAQPSWTIRWFERNHDLAQAVLKLGGMVEIAAPGEAQARVVKEADELVRDYFQVRRVSLASAKPATGGLDDLAKLISQLRDPELERLVSLDLSGATLPDLVFLDGVAGLQEMAIADTRLNDASLGRLPSLPALKRLVLDGNDIRAAGLRHLALTQPRLEELSVNCPSIDAAAAHELPALKALKRLSLAGATLADLTIAPLESLTGLERLDLRQTKITKDGVARLRKALPKCQITWDGGVIEPRK